MRTECECRSLQRHTRRWTEAARFLGSAVSLWAVCAAGIYLIGPVESELVADAPSQAGQAPGALITTAVYHP